MKTINKVQTAAAGLAVIFALSACGGAATSAPESESKTNNTTDISEGIQPDAAAVALLPQSFKDKGELTVAMDLHYPPTTFLAEDNTKFGVNIVMYAMMS